MVRPLVLLVAVLLGSPAGTAGAQQTARSLYDEVLARENALRTDLAAAPRDASLQSPLRGVIAAYEDIVRRYPVSGYCDNALWQAAGLARDAVARWNQDRDRRTLLRLLKWLTAEYPSSPFAPRARDEAARLNVSSASSAASSPAELRSVRRTVLPDVVRVVIELDREVPHATERLDGPPRVLFDFQGSRPGPGIAEGTLSYADDVVRQIRIGVRPDQITRVVLDLDGVRRYSAVAMYNPYRLIVDCDRADGRSASATGERAVPPRPPRAAESITMRSSPPSSAAAPLMAASWGPTYLGLAGLVQPGLPARDLADAGGTSAPRGTATTTRAGVPEKPEPPPTNAGGGFSLARQLGLRVSRVVIDPGHGGHDPGAEGSGISEAAVVLDIALRLERILAADRATEVVLTRRSDVYVGLEERTAIANRAQADLFLSIHANANRSRSIRGVETYYLNFASGPDAASVAARENAAAGMHMGSLPELVKTIALGSKSDESRDFAGMVQQAMVRRLRQVDRNVKDLGVKRAPFVVLIGAAMPSVLAEISFITNGQDARLLRNAVYRQRVAEALADAVRRYQETLKFGRAAHLQ